MLSRFTIALVSSAENVFSGTSRFDNELSLRFHTAIYFSNLSLFFLDSLFNGCFCFFISRYDDSRGLRRNGIGRNAAVDRCQGISDTGLCNSAQG